MLRIKLFCISILLATASLGQENASLEQFSVYEVDGKAYLYWIITAGSYCNGTGVERSADGISFNEIYDIAGVCGGQSFPQAYSYTDSFPFINRTAYYRLRLGNAGYSETVSVLIINSADGKYLITPQPVSTVANIYFRNPQNEKVDIEIFNSNGEKIFSSTVQDELFTHDFTSYASGIYYFRLINSTSTIAGRIMVAR